MVREEKDRFVRDLKSNTIDSTIAYPVARYFDAEINQMLASVPEDRSLTTAAKEKALKSMLFFIKELSRSMTDHKFDLYDIPGAVHSYNNILMALLYHEPLGPVLRPMGSQRSQLMVAAFSQYKEHSLLDDIAVYKRVASSPEYILRFLENKPGFRFADSLLLDAAAYDPLKIVYYLNSSDLGIQGRIRSAHNIYIREIAALSGNKHASELLPFVTLMADGKITEEEILAKRAEPMKYFQLLVDALQYSTNTGAESVFLKPLRNGIKQKGLAFYVNEINELHTSTDAVRFASVKGLRPQDLYYIITSCGEELYTSSYLGLYKRLVDQFKGQEIDSLFDIVHNDNLHVFLRMAANYNVLSDFLHRLSPEKMSSILKRFIAGIESDENAGLDQAMDIADSFSGLGNDPEICDQIQVELTANLQRCNANHHYLGTRLYGILSDILGQVKQKDELNKIWERLGDYEHLKRTALENENGVITELVLFYGDEDGISSFSNFVRTYSDKSKWELTKKANWVEIRSRSEHPLTIFANLPLEIKDEKDLQAQDSLVAYMDEHNLQPSIIVHRGHSYHLDKTLRRLKPSVKLAILGSCGGYNKSISIASINPDVQVIGSKKTGSKSINDPILDLINETLVGNNDLQWTEIWTKLEARFSKDETSLSIFNEYFPPSHNLGLFVLKLFNYYYRFG